MTDFPTLAYSKRQVADAGKIIAGAAIWTDDLIEQDRLREAFRITHSWRDSHALPMRRLRAELVGLIRRTRASDDYTDA